MPTRLEIDCELYDEADFKDAEYHVDLLESQTPDFKEEDVLGFGDFFTRSVEAKKKIAFSVSQQERRNGGGDREPVSLGAMCYSSMFKDVDTKKILVQRNGPPFHRHYADDKRARSLQTELEEGKLSWEEYQVILHHSSNAKFRQHDNDDMISMYHMDGVEYQNKNCPYLNNKVKHRHFLHLRPLIEEWFRTILFYFPDLTFREIFGNSRFDIRNEYNTCIVYYDIDTPRSIKAENGYQSLGVGIRFRLSGYNQFELKEDREIMIEAIQEFVHVAVLGTAHIQPEGFTLPKLGFCSECDQLHAPEKDSRECRDCKLKKERMAEEKRIAKEKAEIANKTKAVNPTGNWVYFMAAGDKIKIGTSVSPYKRLESMLTANPDLEIVHLEPGSASREKQLHKLFKDSHYRREFFLFSEEIKDYLEENKDKNFVGCKEINIR